MFRPTSSPSRQRQARVIWATSPSPTGSARARRRSRASRWQDHLRHLVIHGVLHLGGYDHQTEDDALTMETLERRLLARLGVGDPYALRAMEDVHG